MEAGRVSSGEGTGPSKGPDRRGRRRTRWRLHGWVERLALSSGPDVLALLVSQGEVSLEALDAFSAWSEGAGTDSAHRVRELEHSADDVRRALVTALKESLATPIGQEDLFVLSERCDRVVNRVKNIVREADTMGWAPDAYAAQMAKDLRQGMASILDGFKGLTARGDETSEAALQATRCVRRVEHNYRRAMAEILGRPDLREVFTAREMYRLYVGASEALEALSDRLWYSVLAEP